MTYTTPRAGSESLNLHNEFAPDSIEAKDLRTLLHPSTNLKQHSQQGPVVPVSYTHLTLPTKA